MADDEERGQLGMHYTSVPNILKVLNPLFLDELRQQLEAAGDGSDQGSKRKLLNLRRRLARIRVFDPACGSGNFLVIAYKEMRTIEHELNLRRGEADQPSEIPLTNFRGIELRHFSAEIARLALIIAEFQTDVLYRGDRLAINDFLPLGSENWITCGNALRLDWWKICPPLGNNSLITPQDLFDTGAESVEFVNEGGEVYICGNPPYVGSTWQSKEQKSDLKYVFDGREKRWKSLDYVTGWFLKAADYGKASTSVAAFVATNSICQGQQVPILWPLIFEAGHAIVFAHTSFKWANLASYNAGVTVVIVGISTRAGSSRLLYTADEVGDGTTKQVPFINAYLVPGPNIFVDKRTSPCCGQSEMSFGNKPVDGGHLLLSRDELSALGLTPAQRDRFVRRIYGSAEFIRGLVRYCLWIEDEHLEEALAIPAIRRRVEGVREMRLASRDRGANQMAERAHQFREMYDGSSYTLVVPIHSSDSRQYLPVGLNPSVTAVTNAVFALYDAPLHSLSLIASLLHLVWISSICGKIKTDYRYSNTLGWNTFPIPRLTDQNKADLTECAKDILLARERYWPATIAELYDPKRMDQDFPEVRRAHERNDEVVERIYRGRRFKNDTERLEELFALYEKMVLD